MSPSGPVPSRGAVVVDVWATWCGPCRTMDPILTRVSAEFAGRVDLVRLEVGDDTDLVSGLGVMGVPTLISFRDGGEVGRVTGGVGEEAIRAMFRAAAVGGGPTPPSANTTDMALRGLVALVLLVAGLSLGPSWPLVGVGVALGLWMVLNLVQTVRLNPTGPGGSPSRPEAPDGVP